MSRHPDSRRTGEIVMDGNTMRVVMSVLARLAREHRRAAKHAAMRSKYWIAAERDTQASAVTQVMLELAPEREARQAMRDAEQEEDPSMDEES